MKNSKIISICLVLVMCMVVFAGCGEKPKAGGLSGLTEVAELSTIQCVYHNVATSTHAESKKFFGIGDIGYKKIWIEYTGTVKMGIDAEKIEYDCSEDNVVTVKLPPIEVYDADVIEESIGEPITEEGWFTKTNNLDINALVVEEQEKMLEEAEKDTGNQKLAKKRAKNLIEGYINNIGELTGIKYTVKFEDIE